MPYTPSMLKKDAISHFGSVTALADALGIERQAIYMWGAQVPIRRQYELEEMTGGKLKRGRAGKGSKSNGR